MTQIWTPAKLKNKSDFVKPNMLVICMDARAIFGDTPADQLRQRMLTMDPSILKRSAYTEVKQAQKQITAHIVVSYAEYYCPALRHHVHQAYAPVSYDTCACMTHTHHVQHDAHTPRAASLMIHVHACVCPLTGRGGTVRHQPPEVHRAWVGHTCNMPDDGQPSARTSLRAQGPGGQHGVGPVETVPSA